MGFWVLRHHKSMTPTRTFFLTNEFRKKTSIRSKSVGCNFQPLIGFARKMVPSELNEIAVFVLFMGADRRKSKWKVQRLWRVTYFRRWEGSTAYVPYSHSLYNCALYVGAMYTHTIHDVGIDTIYVCIYVLDIIVYYVPFWVFSLILSLSPCHLPPPRSLSLATRISVLTMYAFMMPNI